MTDNDDHCPYVKHMSKTSFIDHFTVDLYPGHADPLPVWRVAEKVCLACVASVSVEQRAEETGFSAFCPREK